MSTLGCSWSHESVAGISRLILPSRQASSTVTDGGSDTPRRPVQWHGILYYGHHCPCCADDSRAGYQIGSNPPDKQPGCFPTAQFLWCAPHIFRNRPQMTGNAQESGGCEEEFAIFD